MSLVFIPWPIYTHDHIVSPRWGIWAHTISLTWPFFIEIPVTNQESKWPFISVLRVSNLSSSTLFILDFGSVSTVKYFISFYLIHCYRGISWCLKTSHNINYNVLLRVLHIQVRLYNLNYLGYISILWNIAIYFSLKYIHQSIIKTKHKIHESNLMLSWFVGLFVRRVVCLVLYTFKTSTAYISWLINTDKYYKCITLC